jgi:WD40 repeat protein
VLWDVPNHKRLRVLSGHTGSVYRVFFTADSKTLVSYGGGTVKWWNVETAGADVILPIGSWNFLRNCVWFKDSKRMALSYHDFRRSKMELWNTATGQLERAIGEHDNRVNSIAVSPDERWLVSGSDDHTAKLWDVQAGKEVRMHFTPEKKNVEPRGKDSVTAVAFTTDGNRYAVGKGGGTVQLFDRETGQEVWKQNAVLPKHWTTFYNGKQRMGEPAAIENLHFAADGKTLIVQVGGWGHGVFVWDATTGAMRYESEDVSPAQEELPWVVTSDNKTLYYVSERDKSLHAVDLDSAQEIFQHKGFENSAAIAVSADGKTLAIGCRTRESDTKDGQRSESIHLFDVPSRKVTAKLMGHEDKITSLAFVNDPVHGAARQRLVSGSYDHTVKIWNYENGQELLSLALNDRKSDRVEAIFLSPDGTRIAATNGHNKSYASGHAMHVWSAQRPVQLPAIDPDQANLNGVERDMLVIAKSLWVNEKPDAAWNALSAKEQGLASKKPWTKITIDIHPRIRDSYESRGSYVIEPRYDKPDGEGPSRILLWGDPVEENGKRYFILNNRDGEPTKIEYELKDNILRLKGKLYWFPSNIGVIAAPWVFDGEYKAVPRK